MARPWKHPKTGIYWLRKRVPAELRALLGKRLRREFIEIMIDLFKKRAAASARSISGA